MTEQLKNYSLLMTDLLAQKTHWSQKVATRRILRKQPAAEETFVRFDGAAAVFSGGTEVMFPYGGLGAEVYVRENYFAYGKWNKTGEITKNGKAKWKFQDLTGTDFQYKYMDAPPARICKGFSEQIGWYKRPSLYMPASAARSIVIISHIKVERVQDISGADAILEGVDLPKGRPVLFGLSALQTAYKRQFRTLWETIHGEGAWTRNEWVWAISYEKKK